MQPQAEDGVCVDGTTYYIPATAALCGIPEAISPTVLVRASMEKETPPQRQFPGKAYSLYEENLEYPTLSLPKNLRQVGLDRMTAIATQYQSVSIGESSPDLNIRILVSSGNIRSSGSVPPLPILAGYGRLDCLRQLPDLRENGRAMRTGPGQEGRGVHIKV